MAQRCVRVNTVGEMFKGMKGGPFTVEVKFDGNRLQVGGGGECCCQGGGGEKQGGGGVTAAGFIWWFEAAVKGGCGGRGLAG
jgi:hypothetical protein